jgi:PEGA domain-containing protein
MKLLVAGALLSACASKAEEHTLQTADIPKSAEVYLSGVSVGKTPMMVVLDRKKEHHIQFQQEGYKAVSCTLEPGGESEGGSRDWVLLDVMSGFMPAVADVSAHCIIHTRKSTCVPSYLRPAK